nr:immunoglobulin heavy chain junction region [Macaca mulatta]MOV49234.1 immunoglobulin heavy chain junction region [Macaca mulatta]MOV49400.1 immunoglobulin heavy chain junction region [Macaca mulatta]MOV49612.1 immunoglobulin heavy chain junction region [Macaca mulatta]MOV49978.1 immunoglobulin heavy chain junction region [Macaca mulatta]
CTRGDVW